MPGQSGIKHPRAKRTPFWLKLKNKNEDYSNSLPFVFDLSDQQLIFIDNCNMLSVLEQNSLNCQVIGIDTETRPSFYVRKNQNKPLTSLLQIAIRSLHGNENVFLLDLLKLAQLPNGLSTLNSILSKPMQDINVIKIGQGLANDFREIFASYPSLTCFQRVQGILETNSLLRFLKPDIVMQKSLKFIVATYLHSNLCKSQQLSDWGKRPLSEKQLHYAACDALVLLRLYDSMVCEAEEYSYRLGTKFSVLSLLQTFDFDIKRSNDATDGSQQTFLDENKTKSSSLADNMIKGIPISCFSPQERLFYAEMKDSSISKEKSDSVPTHIYFENHKGNSISCSESSTDDGIDDLEQMETDSSYSDSTGLSTSTSLSSSSSLLCSRGNNKRGRRFLSPKKPSNFIWNPLGGRQAILYGLYGSKGK